MFFCAIYASYDLTRLAVTNPLTTTDVLDRCILDALQAFVSYYSDFPCYQV